MIELKDNLGNKLEDNRLPITQFIESATINIWNNTDDNKILYNSKSGNIIKINDNVFSCNFNLLFNCKLKPYYHICARIY